MSGKIRPGSGTLSYFSFVSLSFVVGHQTWPFRANRRVAPLLLHTFQMSFYLLQGVQLTLTLFRAWDSKRTLSLFTDPVTSSSFRWRLNLGGILSAHQHSSVSHRGSVCHLKERMDFIIGGPTLGPAPFHRLVYTLSLSLQEIVKTITKTSVIPLRKHVEKEGKFRIL